MRSSPSGTNVVRAEGRTCPTAGARLSYAEFVDHVPEILERIADRLPGCGPERRRRGPEARAANRPLEAGIRRRRGRQRDGPPPDGPAPGDVCPRPRPRVRPGGHRAAPPRRSTAVLDEAAAEADPAVPAGEPGQGPRRSWPRPSRRRSRRRLASGGKLQTVLNNLAVGVWVINAVGEVVALNREGERLQGFRASETVDRRRATSTSHHSRPTTASPPPTAARSNPPGNSPGLRALAAASGQSCSKEILWQMPGGPRIARSSRMPPAPRTRSGLDRRLRPSSWRRTSPSEPRLRGWHRPAPSRGSARSPSSRRSMIWRSGRLRASATTSTRPGSDSRGRSAAAQAGDGRDEGVHPPTTSTGARSARLGGPSIAASRSR